RSRRYSTSGILPARSRRYPISTPFPHERRRHLDERLAQRGVDIDHRRLIVGQGFTQCGLKLTRFLYTAAVAPHSTGNRGMIKIGEIAGNVALPLTMLDPTQRAIVKDNGHDGNV